ncbi:MAG TPA: gamma-glutamylcyclotransferase [Lautropia sp.]|nr:gamma-glutamylcyclotransferase [Lautropia sp.]
MSIPSSPTQTKAFPPAPAAADPLRGIERLRANWVFAYGSLIWHPGFDYAERHLVRIHGYHRAFCINSTVYRGTPESPGVVLGLDRGGSCHGVAYRIRPGEEEEVVEALYQREMLNHVYKPRMLPVRLPTGAVVEAMTFVARRDHPSYLRLSRDELLRRLSSCSGGRGPNREYAINTWHALREWGIEDAGLGVIARELEAPGCADQDAQSRNLSIALSGQR